MATSEANFDGLVGPTHNYAGLSYGNVASTTNVGAVASPKRAALEGLRKMKALADLGLVQGVLPPHERPDVHILRRLGFTGSEREVVERAAREDRTLLAIASSASAMWVANAATVAPSADTEDGRVHFVPANLIEKAHRAIEAETTQRVLEATFPDRERFAVHDPLPRTQVFSDEGAANHTRLAASGPGVHLFVYGRRALRSDVPIPQRYPARQTVEASSAVARLCRLPASRCVFAQQSPEVIDHGVFHNDVIAVGTERVLFFHDAAFVDGDGVLQQLADRVEGFLAIRVDASMVSIDDAVRSYLFNSQLVRVPGDAALTLIAPEEVHEVESVRRYLEEHVGPDRPIGAVRTFDLRQSMQNGGGPACLRLRVQLTDEERAAVRQTCLLDAALYKRLVAWVERHYRDELRGEDLADPHLFEETRAALDELTQMLELGSIYPFQRSA